MKVIYLTGSKRVLLATLWLLIHQLDLAFVLKRDNFQRGTALEKDGYSVISGQEKNFETNEGLYMYLSLSYS